MSYCLYGRGHWRHAGSMEPADLPVLGEPCDGCGGDAMVRVTLMSGGTLLLCVNCWARHADALRPKAAAVRG